jgi:8-oxo-dGTP pyrophosphatase MutT (NUDIX family)
MNYLHDNAVAALEDYAQKYPEEDLEGVIAYIREHESSLWRSDMHMHITASALLLHESQVLMVHHKALNKFLQVGGHLEPQDTSLYEAAKREILEETGIHAQEHLTLKQEVLNVGVYDIPENPKKNEGAHKHVDCVYVFVAKSPEISLEHSALAHATWVPLEYDFREEGVQKAVSKLRILLQ